MADEKIGKMKSAIEIAMERTADVEPADDPYELTDEHKAKIREINKEYDAKIAEIERNIKDIRRHLKKLFFDFLNARLLFIMTGDKLPVGAIITVALPYSKDRNDKRKGQIVRSNKDGFGVEFFLNPEERIMREDLF